MKKIILSLIMMFVLASQVGAKTIKPDISTVLKDSNVDIESVSISVKSVETGKSIYGLNDKILLNPASVQKILTLPAIVETLGADYEFSTELYSRGANAFLIKLGADPYLKSTDLKALLSKVGPDTETFYIDDKILDTKTWGEGWQWDDNMNILMPRFGAYNLDRNLIKLTIVPTETGHFATIINPSKYPFVFFNNIKTGNENKIDIQQDNLVSVNKLIMTGTVSKPVTVYIPIGDLKRYFDIQLTRILEGKKIYLKSAYVCSQKKSTDKLENKIIHKLELAINDVFKNSNNLVAETLFKLAGAKYCNLESGTDAAGIKMFNDYCVKNNIDNSRIRIVDGSGVSKNNLVSTNFVTDLLLVNKDNSLMQSLPMPGEGTLANRMLPLKENLRAKTGTLCDTSSLAGYLTSKKGKQYVFCIIINDMKLSSSDKKMLEDFIVRELYLRL